MRLSVKRYLSLLAIYLKPQWFRTAIMALLLLLDVGLQLLNPQILRYFIDTALNGGASASLIYAAIFFIAVAILGQGSPLPLSISAKMWHGLRQIGYGPI